MKYRCTHCGVTVKDWKKHSEKEHGDLLDIDDFKEILGEEAS